MESFEHKFSNAYLVFPSRYPFEVEISTGHRGMEALELRTLQGPPSWSKRHLALDRQDGRFGASLLSCLEFVMGRPMKEMSKDARRIH